MSSKTPVVQKPTLWLVKLTKWVLFNKKPDPLQNKLQEQARVPELVSKPVIPMVKDAD